jgi:hypothetical protein
MKKYYNVICKKTGELLLENVSVAEISHLLQISKQRVRILKDGYSETEDFYLQETEHDVAPLKLIYDINKVIRNLKQNGKDISKIHFIRKEEDVI